MLWLYCDYIAQWYVSNCTVCLHVRRNILFDCYQATSRSRSQSLGFSKFEYTSKCFLYIFLLPFRIFVVMGNLFALSKISFLRCFLSFFFFSSLIAPFFVFYFSFYLIPFLSSFHFTRFSFLASPHSFYLSSHILFFLEFSIFWLNSS